ncbi:MAG: EscU/YscU/HrcU family type III secretion system export apparatus switch protein [Myxococcota bacterium]|nr:EscU/YscU/HrcU family type III secretion system export apparatus switch protein [Myxococcota bacterium]
MSEKTEAPTPQRLRKAREQGQLPRSRMLNGAVVSAAAITASIAFAPEVTAHLMDWTRQLLQGPQLEPTLALAGAVQVLVRASAPPLLAALLAAVAVSVGTTGFKFAPVQALPKLERIDPAAGFKRLFSLKQLGELGRSVLVCALLGWLMWRAVRESGPALIVAIYSHAERASAAFLGPLLEALQDVALVFAVVGLGDYALARHRHLRELRMSRQEVKQEHKDSEGDPRHKAHRKALHRQLSARGPARGVHKATTIVVNPTHIAVALRYQPDECDAPYLVAKGREGDALALRAEAKRLGIPVVRDIPLARSLIHFDVGDEIPEELYRAAAGVLHAAEQLRSQDPHPQEETP